MRILFAMAYPGYLRYFDAPIRALLDRGHQVNLVFESIDKQPEGLHALDEHPALRVGGRMPKRGDRWAKVAHGERHLTDYVRYLDPRLADAGYLRSRAGERLPRAFRFLHHRRTLPRAVVRAAVRGLVTAESVLPRDPGIDAYVAQQRPDVVVVTPLVTLASRGADLVASARAAGLPTAVCVASWDHLTTKGIMRIVPDRVLLWNEVQRREAVELHDVPAERVVITGAQPFDRWFGREPGRDRKRFCARVGLPADKPYMLFVGSTASISAPETEKRFVRRWIEALRASDDQRVREAAVLVRPHPYNSDHWDERDLRDLDDVAVFPRGGANPVDEGDRTDYFDSIHHCAAVVGINTSAMIESAIQFKPVLSVTLPDFTDTQGGTLHFRHLLPENGGFLRVARNLDEHVGQLAAVLGDPVGVRVQLEGFVRTFVRPHGLDRPATPIVADAIEGVADLVPADDRPGPLAAAPVRVALAIWLVMATVTDRRGQARWLRNSGRAAHKRLRRAANRTKSPVRTARHVAQRLTGTGPVGRLAALAMVPLVIRPLDLVARLSARVLRVSGGELDAATTALARRLAPPKRPVAPVDPEAPSESNGASAEDAPVRVSSTPPHSR